MARGLARVTPHRTLAFLAAAAAACACAPLARAHADGGAAPSSAACAAPLGCAACADAGCSWQADGCRPAGCPLLDVGCYTLAASCPAPEAVCAAASGSCRGCAAAGCVWQAGECVDECRFGPLGDFIAACTSDDAECEALEVKAKSKSKSKKKKKKKKKKKRKAKAKKIKKKAKKKAKKEAAKIVASAPSTAGRLAQGSTCAQELLTGNCRAYFRRWGFDATQSKCIEFVYGGCGANENNFESEKECQAACPSGV